MTTTATTPTTTWPPPGWTEDDVEQLSLARTHLHVANEILYELLPKIDGAVDHDHVVEPVDGGMSDLRASMDGHEIAQLEEDLDAVLYARGDLGAFDYHRLVVGRQLDLIAAIATLRGDGSGDADEHVRGFLSHRDRVLARGAEVTALP